MINLMVCLAVRSPLVFISAILLSSTAEAVPPVAEEPLLHPPPTQSLLL
jgi:hypothetical protein